MSLEELAQQTIATQAVIKEMGFGSHFRSYVLKAVRREMAIAAPVQLVRQTLGHTSLHNTLRYGYAKQALVSSSGGKAAMGYASLYSDAYDGLRLRIFTSANK
ncbi:hypothetical protein [Nostoc sp.]